VSVEATPDAPGSAEGPESDHDVARRLAVSAGQLLVELRHEMRAASPWRLMDEGDRQAHLFLVDALATARPDDAVLSEEGRDSAARVSRNRVWIVDPLDGTNEYGEAGRSDWAVHVALWEAGELVAGAVSLPAQGDVFATGPYIRPECLAFDRAPRIVTSRNRAPYAAAVVAQELGLDVLRLGSAGAKTMAVLQGHAELYVHDGGMHEWDVAAPAVVAAAHGLHVSRLRGDRMQFNKPDPWLPDLVIGRPELAEAALEVLWGPRPT
jgi:3'(2'), 5'-bisphosphate nucleotidase